MTIKSAGISEIFSSIQGEGTHLGERHLFVRFEHCNIHCDYCDELGKVGTVIELDEAMKQIEKIDSEEGPHAFVSLTGGEPLVYGPFTKDLAKQLKQAGSKVYLETNGILWRQLETVIDWADVVAMDLKPASVTKERSYVEEHSKFLEIAAQKEVFTKMVLSREIDVDEYVGLCELIKEIDPEIPLILQPISSAVQEGHEDAELMSLLNQLQRIGLGIVKNVRIVPRLHKILKIK